MTISVRVTLMGALRTQEGGKSEITIDLPDGATVKDAIFALGIKDQVDIWALIDGERVLREATLGDRSHLTLFHPVGGG